MTDCPVLIVGAGPTGLVLALWLTRLGVRVRIIDKTAEPGTTSRAVAVQARTLEFYRQVDLAGAVDEAGVQVAAANLWVGDAKAAPGSRRDALRSEHGQLEPGEVAAPADEAPGHRPGGRQRPVVQLEEPLQHPLHRADSGCSRLDRLVALRDRSVSPAAGREPLEACGAVSQRAPSSRSS